MILERFKNNHCVYYAFLTAYCTGLRIAEVFAFVNVNIKMYKFLKIRMYKSVHFYFQLFPFFSFASINLSFNL